MYCAVNKVAKINLTTTLKCSLSIDTFTVIILLYSNITLWMGTFCKMRTLTLNALNICLIILLYFYLSSIQLHGFYLQLQCGKVPGYFFHHCPNVVILDFSMWNKVLHFILYKSGCLTQASVLECEYSMSCNVGWAHGLHVKANKLMFC